MSIFTGTSGTNTNRETFNENVVENAAANIKIIENIDSSFYDPDADEIQLVRKLRKKPMQPLFVREILVQGILGQVLQMRAKAHARIRVSLLLKKIE